MVCGTEFSHMKAKSRKYQGVFDVNSRVKTWQVQGIWSQQLEHKQVPKWGTEPGVRKGKRSLLACHTRRKRSIRCRSSSVRSLNWCRVEKTGLTIKAYASPQKGAEPGVQRGRCSLLACHTILHIIVINIIKKEFNFNMLVIYMEIIS